MPRYAVRYATTSHWSAYRQTALVFASSAAVARATIMERARQRWPDATHIRTRKAR